MSITISSNQAKLGEIVDVSFPSLGKDIDGDSVRLEIKWELDGKKISSKKKFKVLSPKKSVLKLYDQYLLG